MEFQIVENKRIGEKYYRLHHKSGLVINVFPKEGFNSAYAVIGTNFGSVNNHFISGGREIKVPDGTAHYLEHKLFESEEGDAFSQYAKTGAMANAYTSFEKTCYLFSCTENFRESLEILLDLIQSPYFTPETVAKEQGIIGQEIKMYDDSADWRVMINLYQAMYHNNPINKDIAGDVESIAQITPEILYECYHAYYNLNNMVLSVAGNVSPYEVLEIADRKLKDSPPFDTQNIFTDEPYEVKEKYVEQKLPVAVPMFYLGFKEKAATEMPTVKELVCTDILLQAFAGEGSELYREMLDKKLINSSFGADYLAGRGYRAVTFEGETHSPSEAAEAICAGVRKLKEKGISREDFEIAKRSVYGSMVSSFDSLSSVANLLIGAEFCGRTLFDYIETIAGITFEEVCQRLNDQLDPENISLSVIKGIDD